MIATRNVSHTNASERLHWLLLKEHVFYCERTEERILHELERDSKIRRRSSKAKVKVKEGKNVEESYHSIVTTGRGAFSRVLGLVGRLARAQNMTRQVSFEESFVFTFYIESAREHEQQNENQKRNLFRSQCKPIDIVMKWPQKNSHWFRYTCCRRRSYITHRSAAATAATLSVRQIV